MKAFTKDISELLPTAQLPELHARLRHTLEQRGLMVLSGEPGVGKTATVRAFCGGLDPTTCTVLYLADPGLTTRGLYRLLGAALGLETPWSGSRVRPRRPPRPSGSLRRRRRAAAGPRPSR